MDRHPATRVANVSSRRLLVVLGLLWLLLAALVIASRIIASPGITIEWVTETEVDTAGFNIYRSQSPEGSYQRLNSTLLPSEGSAVSGSSYSFVDTQVVAGQTYYYQLEDVELDNSAVRHETIPYTAPSTPWWEFATIGISVVFGLILVLKGLK